MLARAGTDRAPPSTGGGQSPRRRPAPCRRVTSSGRPRRRQRTRWLLLAAGVDATCGAAAARARLLFLGRGTLLERGEGHELLQRPGGRRRRVRVHVDPAPDSGRAVAVEYQRRRDGRVRDDDQQQRVLLGVAECGSARQWHRERRELGSPPSLVVTNSAQSPAVLFNRITAGGSHACGLTPANTAWCWGSEALFQLGNGDGFHVNSMARRFQLAAARGYSSISAGVQESYHRHSLGQRRGLLGRQRRRPARDRRNEQRERRPDQCRGTGVREHLGGSIAYLRAHRERRRVVLGIE